MILDEIAGDMARLERDRDEGPGLEIPRSWLPAGAREGSVLRVTAGSDLSSDTPGDISLVRFTLDRESESRRRERIRTKLDRLRRGSASS